MYRYVVVEIFLAQGEASRHKFRARPLPGQGFDVDTRVECSARFRRKEHVGKLFKIWAKVKDTEQKTQLYSHHSWGGEPISKARAKAFIAAKNWQ